MKNSFKQISKKALDGIVDIARVNLFCPRTGYDDAGNYGGYYPKGIIQTIFADIALGTYIGSQSSNPEQGMGLGFAVGAFYPILSGYLGSYFVEKVSDLKKRRNKRKENPIDHARDYNF